jgi:uncharacterized protein with PIN domain
MTAAPRFLCDAMLGDVARDLRLLGFDVAYDADVDDTTLLDRARREARVLATRDRQLAQRAGPLGALVAPGEGTAELLAALGLRPDPAAFLSRCTRCGGALRDVAAAARADRLPPDVAARHQVVRECDACGHLYWKGSHVDAIRRRLGDLAPPERRE